MGSCKKFTAIADRKRKFVVRHLADEYGVNPVKVSKKPSNILSSTVKDAILAFYVRDDISRQAPGRKDCVTVREGSNKSIWQKRHMYTTLSEAHELLLKEYPHLKVGRSSFAKLRPPRVLLSSDTPANVCICQKHANVQFLLEKIPNLPGRCSEFVQLIVCNTTSKECFLGLYRECKNLKLFHQLVDDMPDDVLQNSIAWFKWCLDDKGKTVKVVQEGLVSDAIEKLTYILPDFLEHVYCKNKQAGYFEQKRTYVEMRIL